MKASDLLTAFFVVSGIASILGLVAVFVRRDPGPGAKRRAGAFRPAQGPIRIQFAAALLAAVVVSCGFAAVRGGVGCQDLLIASSQEKYSLLREFATDYNQSGRYFGPGGGRCASVSVEKVNSGDAESYLVDRWAAGPDRPPAPDVWAPASSAWVQLLAADLGPERPAPAAEGYLFQSPLVIGMPQPMAEALGYPALPIGWTDIFELATNAQGWGARGHPEWGAFRLGKTNPHVSTSGLHALVGTFHAAGGDDSPAAADAAPVRTFAKGVESSVLHYGLTANDFLRNLYEVDNSSPPPHLFPLQYVSAIAVEEKELTDYNLGLIADQQRAPPHVRLVPIYPSPGTPVADHPYVVVGGADKHGLALDFLDFIRTPVERDRADRAGFRVGNGIDGVGGAGPHLAERDFVNKAPAKRVSAPAGLVLQTELRVWDQVRKPARVLILADRSLDAKSARYLAGAVDGFQPQDHVGLAVFPSGSEAPYRTALPITAMDGAGLQALRAAIQAEAGGPAGRFEASLAAGLTAMRDDYDPDSINAIVLVDLTPGTGNADSALTAGLRDQPPGKFVRIFAVGPDTSRLRQVALAGEGSFYEPRSSREFFNDVISNF